jgi:hypothetical protein
MLISDHASPDPTPPEKSLVVTQQDVGWSTKPVKQFGEYKILCTYREMNHDQGCQERVQAPVKKMIGPRSMIGVAKSLQFIRKTGCQGLI